MKLGGRPESWWVQADCEHRLLAMKDQRDAWRERAERAEAEVERLRIATHDMHIPCVHRAEAAEARVAELEAECDRLLSDVALVTAEAERDAALDLLREAGDAGYGPRLWLTRVRAFLSTRTPRPRDDPSGIALLGDPWEG